MLPGGSLKYKEQYMKGNNHLLKNFTMNSNKLFNKLSIPYLLSSQKAPFNHSFFPWGRSLATNN